MKRTLMLALCRVSFGLLATMSLSAMADDGPDPAVVAKLKRLHSAFEGYRKDHGGDYPPLIHADTAGGRLLWPDLLKPYLNDRSPAGRVAVDGPFFAPYVPVPERAGGKSAYVSFGYPRFSLGADAPGYRKSRRPVHTVPNPEKTLLLVECDAPKQSGTGWYSAYPNLGIDFSRCNGKAHVLFCDGTVALWTPEQLNVGDTPDTAAAPWYSKLSRNPKLTGSIPAPVPARVAAVDKGKSPSPPPGPPKPVAKTPPPKKPVSEDGPLVTVAKIKVPPTIDGILSPNEWTACSAFAGYSSYVTRQLNALDVASFAGYDDTALYLAFLVPLPRGAEPRAKVTERDGRVYKEDAVEIILDPAGDGDIRQLVVNAIGTVFDRRGAETAWQGNWLIATSRGTAEDLPPYLTGSTGFWSLELALPFKDLGLATPQPGDTWRANFCTDGQHARVFAPTFDSYLDRAEFARMRFLGSGAPSLHLPTLGELASGNVTLTGLLRNPSAQDMTVDFRIDAEKEGTRIVERTGFDEIVGALFKWEDSVSLPTAATVPLSLNTTMEDMRLNRFRITATATDADGRPTCLYRQQGEMKILPPLRVSLENYPTNEELVLNVDISGLGPASEARRLTWQIRSEDKPPMQSAESAMTGLHQSETIDISGLTPGTYALRVDITNDKGASQANTSVPFVKVRNPAWFRNDIGSARTVLPPFTPLERDGQTVAVWGRSMAWSDASVLPSAITSVGTALLDAPARIVLTVNGKEQRIGLQTIDFTATAPDRTEFSITGNSAAISAEGSGWVAYDGLIWFDVALTSRHDATLSIDSCKLEFALNRHAELYYHGVPDRSMTGRIEGAELEFPDQTYFWIGGCEKGLGVILDSGPDLTQSKLPRFRILPRTDHVLWQIDLSDRTDMAPALKYRFGIQATPVRPLPPDWHSWLSVDFRDRSDNEYAEIADAIDMTTIWEKFRGDPESWWRPVFSDPMGVRTDKVSVFVADAHARRTPAILYSCPMNFTDNARPEYTTYGNEWCTMPRTRWKCAGFTQSRACARSSFPDWLLHHFRNTIRETGLDGLYFDGAGSGDCINQHHGCGWVGPDGKRHPSRQLLPTREFNRRVATMLHEEVEPRRLEAASAAHRPGWPRYYNWIHISGAVCPPLYSFNTAYFCGEWFKGALKRGKSYRELLTLDTFRPRYISTPWGVPNFFLPITRERKGDITTETECVLAYMLPHGTPIYPRYLNAELIQTVLRAMAEFDTKGAAFTPCWRENKLLKLDSSGNRNVLLAVWQRDGEILAVLANVGNTRATPRLAWEGGKDARIGTLFSRTGPLPKRIAPGHPAEIEVGANTFILARIAYEL
ncbi:MAG: carbohydrate-binding family 9-like protein [Lentisphaerae bacterium]|nr:carbohydrate-binding family 9-like protein [Lentisphaerota bacterium]MBT4822353.1 carbohydrate-binding family 9-like protein [Lentisphaerota bacterium]MBT5612944.1 carbohydrate-binding family 9-like protein [Lentisphaerota bacterium]MBT7053601.1 carbohydrate-binding family 9-like protein [Lentisphaerota bacterium]MBT7843141.1 carbohydrate-binding family 9-like protein [Lentisphaerota bacterium]